MMTESPLSHSSVLSVCLTLSSCALLFLTLRERKSNLNQKSPAAKEDGQQFVVRKATSVDDYVPALPTLTKDKMRKRDLFTESGSNRFALELILSPHQKYPAHLHGSNEWCFLTQGELTDQFGTKYAGDFFYNEHRSLHYSIQAGAEGCTILVVKDHGNNIPRPELDA